MQCGACPSIPRLGICHIIQCVAVYSNGPWVLFHLGKKIICLLSFKENFWYNSGFYSVIYFAVKSFFKSLLEAQLFHWTLTHPLLTFVYVSHSPSQFYLHVPFLSVLPGYCCLHSWEWVDCGRALTRWVEAFQWGVLNEPQSTWCEGPGDEILQKHHVLLSNLTAFKFCFLWWQNMLFILSYFFWYHLNQGKE